MWDPFGRFLNERERESYSPNSIPARIGVLARKMNMRASADVRFVDS